VAVARIVFVNINAFPLFAAPSEAANRLTPPLRMTQLILGERMQPQRVSGLPLLAVVRHTHPSNAAWIKRSHISSK
jgi:hypothetical protein